MIDQTKMHKKVWAKICPNITFMQVWVTFPLLLLYIFLFAFSVCNYFLRDSPTSCTRSLSYIYCKYKSILPSHSEYWVLSHKKKRGSCSHYLSKTTIFKNQHSSLDSWNHVLAWSKSGPKESLSITPCPVEDTSAFWTSSSLEIAFPKKTESSTTDSTHMSNWLNPPSASPQDRHRDTHAHTRAYARTLFLVRKWRYHF